MVSYKSEIILIFITKCDHCGFLRCMHLFFIKAGPYGVDQIPGARLKTFSCFTDQTSSPGRMPAADAVRDHVYPSKSDL